MKKKMSKPLAVILAAAMSLGLLAGCGGSGDSVSGDTQAAAEESSGGGSNDSQESSDSSDMHTITMALIGNEQPRQEEIWAKVNELVEKDLNMHVNFIVLGYGDYINRLNLMLSGGDKLDILPINNGQAGSYINAGQIVDLKDYIYDYGQDIISSLGEDIATSAAVQGFVYGTPPNKESASRAGIVMRKDIVDELGIDVDSIHTYADLTAVFEKVKAAHPELDCIAGTNILTQVPTWDPLMDQFGVLPNDGQDTTVVNLFEYEDFVNHARLVNEWYKAGYVKLDAATTTETSQNLVKAGSLFSYFSPIKPGFLAQENVVCNQEMVTAYIDKDDGSVSNIICSNNVNFFNWGIAQQSEDKVKAMQFLNYCYSSPEWNNLMNFGEEGVDYEKMEGSDIMIHYPEGADTASLYHFNMGWMLPNQYLGYVWEGNPEDVWQQYQDFNDSATYSKAFGFFADTSSLSTELTALYSVYNEYMNSISTGSVSDFDATMKDFNDKLYAAGLQKVMDLKQEQLDAWLASKQ